MTERHFAPTRLVIRRYVSQADVDRTRHDITKEMAPYFVGHRTEFFMRYQLDAAKIQCSVIRAHRSISSSFHSSTLQIRFSFLVLKSFAWNCSIFTLGTLTDLLENLIFCKIQIRRITEISGEIKMIEG